MIEDFLIGFCIGCGVTAMAFGRTYRDERLELQKLGERMERLCARYKAIIERDERERQAP